MTTFSTLLVYNSITNSLNDEKFDNITPFEFVEFLNYVEVIDVNDNDNFIQYKQYLNKWEKINQNLSSNIQDTIRNMYINFLNDLALNYSTNEERRFLENIDLENEKDLSTALPFYANKICDIISYYREKRNTYKKELREIKGKGSVDSVKQFVQNNIIDFFNSEIQGNVNIQDLSNNILITIENSYGDGNVYDKPFSSTPENSSNIEWERFLDIEKALVNVLNEKNIPLRELLPQRLTVKFDRFDSSFLSREDFINNNTGPNERDNLKVLFEAELTKRFTGTDYFYLSTNTQGDFLSGTLFEADNIYENAFNINNPVVMINPVLTPVYEREIGFFYRPTIFSILRVDGDFDVKIKPSLKSSHVYVFPDPNKYGNIVNASEEKPDSPFSFFFDESTFKNASSSDGRRIPKTGNDSQYFYSYSTYQKNRNVYKNDGNQINVHTDGDFKRIVKLDNDIHGNEFVLYIDDIGLQTRVLPFYYSNTLPKAVLNIKNNIKEMSIKDAVTGDVVPLSGSSFATLFKKYGNVFNEGTYNNVLNCNFYSDVLSFDTSNFSVIDRYEYSDGVFKIKYSTPLFIPKNVNNIEVISDDLVQDNTVLKMKVSLQSGTIYNNKYFYELFSYDLKTNNSQILLSKENLQPAFFDQLFEFAVPSKIERIVNTTFNYNSLTDTYTFCITYHDKNKSPYIHILSFKLTGTVTIVENIFYRPQNNIRTTIFNSPNVLTDFYNISSFNSTPAVDDTNQSLIL